MPDSAFTRSQRLWPNPGRRLAVALAGISLLGGVAAAQPAPVPPPDQPLTTTHAALAVTPVAPPGAVVQTQPLAPPDLFSVGAAASDLPGDLWSGASPALMRLVLTQLQAQPVSPAAAALARYLLSVGAPGPSGGGDDADLAGLRLLALLKLGDAAAVQSIADRTALLSQRPALSQAAAEADLILGQDDKACAVGDALAAGRDQLYWIELRGYCQVRAGQAAPAQLTYSLAEQAGAGPDYSRLMGALLAGRMDGAPALDSGLDFALSRKAAQDWTSGLAAAAPAIAVAVARDPAAPAPLRLQAAARAARAGLPVREAYAALTPVPPDVATADAPGPAGEAALVALADTSSDWTVKEAAVTALLKRARSGPELLALARLAAPSIAQLTGAKAVLHDPLTFAAAAAAVGDAASARAARSQVLAGSAPPLELAIVDALIAASSGEGVSAAINALTAARDPASRGRADAALAILSGFGPPLGSDLRFELATAELGPSRLMPGRVIALNAAASDRHAGETALYVLLASLETGPGGPSAGDRALMVRALSAAALQADARAYAVEGLLGLLARP